MQRGEGPVNGAPLCFLRESQDLSARARIFCRDDRLDQQIERFARLAAGFIIPAQAVTGSVEMKPCGRKVAMQGCLLPSATREIL